MKKSKVFNRELVLCVGSSNYLYAKSMHQELPRELQSSIAVETWYPTNNLIVDLKNEAIRLKRVAVSERIPYNNIWLLFDCPPCCTAHAADIMALRKDFNLAYVPICIEQWFMLHFEKQEQLFSCSDEAIICLKKFWPDYKRGQVNAYRELFNQMPIAIQRANLFNTGKHNDNELLNPYFTIQNLIQYFDAMKIAA